jgi:hypothetical protein
LYRADFNEAFASRWRSLYHAGFGLSNVRETRAPLRRRVLQRLSSQTLA